MELLAVYECREIICARLLETRREVVLKIVRELELPGYMKLRFGFDKESYNTYIESTFRALAKKVENDSGAYKILIKFLKDTPELEDLASSLENKKESLKKRPSQLTSHVSREETEQKKIIGVLLKNKCIPQDKVHMRPAKRAKNEVAVFPTFKVLPQNTADQNRVISELTVDDLGDVQEECYEARAKWYNIGLALGLTVDTLDSIEDNYKDIETKFRNMLKKWLETGDNRNWKTLTDCLSKKAVGFSVLGKELSLKFSKKSTV